MDADINKLPTNFAGRVLRSSTVFQQPYYRKGDFFMILVTLRG
jgi:hypothetical protein